MTEARADALPSTPQRRVPHRALPEAGRLTYVLRQRFSYTYDAPVRELDHRLVVVPPRRHAGQQRRRRYSITVSAADARTTHRRDAAGNIVKAIRGQADMSNPGRTHHQDRSRPARGPRRGCFFLTRRRGDRPG
jgi:transglutaminase-like putative cysteine protease